MCLKCKEPWRPVLSRGLCGRCYDQARRDGTREEWPLRREPTVKIVVCRSCAREMRHKARGLCATCYEEHRVEDTLGQFETNGVGHPAVGLDVVARKPRKPSRRPVAA